MDKLDLRELVLRARGERSSNKFAKECGVSPSTITRIENGEIKKAISEEVLKKIYKHKDPSCEFTYEDFKNANAQYREDREDSAVIHFRLKKENDDESSGRRSNALATVEKLLERERKSHQIITDMVLDSDVPVAKQAAEYKLGEFFDVRIDASFTLHLSNKKKDCVRWDFEFMNSDVRRSTDDGKLDRFAVGYRADRVLNKIAKYKLVTENNGTDILHRLAVVVTDREIFDAVREALSYQPFCGDISILLIDLDKSKVLNEAVLNPDLDQTKPMMSYVKGGEKCITIQTKRRTK